MKTIGFAGLGDMGLAMSRNILNAGFPLTGFDLRQERLALLEQSGGKRAANCTTLAKSSDSVFVMVLNGAQVREVVLGDEGLIHGLKPGSTVIISATISPSDVKGLQAPLSAKGIQLIDSPVSGGLAGAEGGSLTLMTAAKPDILESNRDVLDSVSKVIHHVGDEIGMGQTVKASLQAMIGSVFAAIFESLVLGAKAGVKGETLYNVISSSGVGCGLFDNCAKLIMERKFKGTGSQITTMYKDLGISMGLARDNGVPMHMASTAYEMFQSGISMFPDEDNWAIVKLLEQIADTEVTW